MRPSLARRLAAAVGVAAVLSLAVTAWIAWNVGQGGRDLQQAAAQLKDADLSINSDGTEVERLLESTSRAATDARRHLEDPLVRAAAALPLVGEPLQTATSIAISADAAVGGALLPLARAAGPAPQEALFRAEGGIDTGFLRSLQQPSQQGAEALQAAVATLDGAPSDTQLAALDQARADVESELDRLQEAVSSLALAAKLGPELLGGERPRTYLLVAQNPAEARGTGGLVGGYILVRADEGRLSVVANGPNTDFEAFRLGEPVVDLGPEFAEHYGHNGATRAWVNSNLSPHFPHAAKIWRELWKEQTGQQVDGLMTVDPVVLSYLLKATGPVEVSDGEQVTAANVVELTLQDVYVAFDSPGGSIIDRRGERKEYLQQVAGAVAERLTTQRPDGTVLLRALTRSVQEQRLLLWTGAPEVDDVLNQHAITGQLPDRPAVGDVIVNAGGSKLDYYLDRSLRLERGCGSSSRLTLSLTNGAPATGLPAYVNPPQYRKGLPEGTNESIVTLYVPLSSRVDSLRLDGQEVPFHQGPELGHRWIETFVALRPGESRELTVEFTETSTAGVALERIAQPLVRPETYTAVPCAADDEAA